MLDRVTDDGRVGVQFEFLEDPASVGAHRFGAHSQLGGDLLEGSSGAEHTQHLVFSV